MGIYNLLLYWILFLRFVEEGDQKELKIAKCWIIKVKRVEDKNNESRETEMESRNIQQNSILGKIIFFLFTKKEYKKELYYKIIIVKKGVKRG